MTPRESELFFQMLITRHFPIATKSDIARLLDGSARSGLTTAFVEKMVGAGCLKYEGMRPFGRREIPVYSRDKSRMRDFFEGTIYHRMAQEFVTDPLGDILRNDKDPLYDMARKIVDGLHRRGRDAGGDGP